MALYVGAWHGLAGPGTVWQAMQRMASRGAVRHGMAWRGKAGEVM